MVVEPCDVTDRAQLAALFDRHAIAAVVHTAGALDDGVIASLTPDRLDAVFAPKVRRRAAPARATDGPLILFSAAAGILGGPGQGNYAAANAFTDALARHRRRHGRPATALAWGFWAGRSDLTGHLDEAQVGRMGPFAASPRSPPGEGLALFDAGVASGAPAGRAGPAPTWRPCGGRDRSPPLLRALVRALGRGGSPRSPEPTRSPTGWPSPPTGSGSCSTWSGRRSRTVLGYATPEALDTTRAFMRARLRLAHGGRPAQPAGRRHGARSSRPRWCSTTRTRRRWRRPT